MSFILIIPGWKGGVILRMGFVLVWFRSYPVLERGLKNDGGNLGSLGRLAEIIPSRMEGVVEGVRNNTRDSSNNSRDREWIIWQNHGRRVSSLERGVGGEWRDGPTVCYHFYNTPYSFPKIQEGWKCLL